ncbi:hypothetical protein C8A00DRAFT_45878 [Chaetomidium leptoderma]|uniref:DUF7896 domain-containing protein n=1 Tax=Chaetomidium leptoderma TaxID=669021 RepID=A0AAN6VG03_9PEZI|nr:hypothetical protein C8A00DRAFT_45878 [Chaetomidium leptoderma]
MSQPNQVDDLKARLEQNEREKRELMEQLNRAQSFAAPTPASDQSRPMKRSKTTHAAGSSTAAPMMRSRSSISRPGLNSTPFVTRGPGPSAAPPPLSPFFGNNLTRSLGGYLPQSQPQYPTHAFAPDTFPLAGSLVQQNGLVQQGELGREMAVDDYLSMHDDSQFPTTSPIDIPTSTLLSPQDLGQYPSSSFPSVCGSMTSGPTLETAPMSRRGSVMNDSASISNQFSEMVRIRSQQSAQSFRPSPIATHPPLLGKRFSEDSGVIAMQGDSFMYTYPSSAPAHSVLAQHQHPMEESLSQSSIQSTSSSGLSPHDLSGPILAQHLSMERSISKDSIKSNSSLKYRAKESLARQNYAATRQLQPKPAAGALSQETPDSVTNSAKDGKAAISKAQYQRPKHPKVMCSQCNEQPEGFRGEHELRRHTEAKHKSMVRKWICRDPDLDAIPHAETAVKPLKDCKQCSQSKQYGAYYNAAAHLRRTHFKVKPRKGAAGSKNGQSSIVDEEKEKRGGKGGGDWPPMSELKLWMVEVTVPMDQDGALCPDGAEIEADDHEDDFPDSQYHSQTGISMPMGPGGFDMTTFAGVGQGFSQASDMAGASYHGELDSSLSEMYPHNAATFPAPPLQGVPISSAEFDYRNADLSTQQSITASLMSLNSHGYTSPVSSSATITQTGIYMDQFATMQPPRDELAELPFDLTFNTVQ